VTVCTFPIGGELVTVPVLSTFCAPVEGLTATMVTFVTPGGRVGMVNENP